MIIEVDIREKRLIELIESKLNTDSKLKNISIQSKVLHIGDICILNDSLETILVIERKSINDLASSIVDGRYSEQSCRLSHSNTPNHNIVYVIEGRVNDLNTKYTRITHKALYSAMIVLQYFKGFSVFRTMNIDETAEYILRVTDKMMREMKNGKQGYYNNYEETQENRDQISPYIENLQVKMKKQDNITVDNINEIMLCQVPKVSLQTAKVIIQKYGTMYNLMEALKSNPKCLDDIKLETKTGSKRSIQKQAKINIIHYLVDDYREKQTIHVETNTNESNVEKTS